MPPAEPSLPEQAISERFLAATGPGGQNVNKVATAVQLRLDVAALGLAPDVLARLRALAGSRWTSAAEIVVTARAHRSREANREAARARLADLLAKAHVRQAKRRKTRPTLAAKARRADAKSARGAIKKGRGRVTME